MRRNLTVDKAIDELKYRFEDIEWYSEKIEVKGKPRWVIVGKRDNTELATLLGSQRNITDICNSIAATTVDQLRYPEQYETPK